MSSCRCSRGMFILLWFRIQWGPMTRVQESISKGSQVSLGDLTTEEVLAYTCFGGFRGLGLNLGGLGAWI